MGSFQKNPRKIPRIKAITIAPRARKKASFIELPKAEYVAKRTIGLMMGAVTRKGTAV